MQARDISDAIRYMVTHPRHVAINEILRSSVSTFRRLSRLTLQPKSLAIR